MVTVLDQSQALLVEVATHLNEVGIAYVVVGGWSPYLRNKCAISHPGTKDVDVLLPDAEMERGIGHVIERFLANGFSISAKHDFQLLKQYNVGGRNLVFNVDLLHPSEIRKQPEMFVDHLDLHIYENDLGDTKSVKSIVLPSSKILFQNVFSNKIAVADPIAQTSVLIPIITESGCILSKCESVKSDKRKRDAFDIYLSLLNIGSERFSEEVKPYVKIDGVRDMVTALRQWISTSDGAMAFDENVRKYAKPNGELGSPAKFVLCAIEKLV